MNSILRLSEVVYVELCHKIGSPTEVRMRREVDDTGEEVDKTANIMRGFDRMLSGSRREGFRLVTSDSDYMFWPPDHKVICDLSQVSLYRMPQHTVMLIECDDIPPGFTRLNLKSPSNDNKIRSSCVFIYDKIYLSSTLFRDNHLQYVESRYAFNSFNHGPCSTFSLRDIEADMAFCFYSHHWPIKALPWIQRCRQQGWPSDKIVSDILSGGFHVVPIGSTPENELEWRISFSKAEQKIVYSMNHCQFLCYGLFKIFLKEIIDSQNDASPLCSYFIKTCVFWVIQNDKALKWTPYNLLSCFWKCFQLLIYWVHIGECPNFFIPQNNMFRVKVTGFVQASLFSQLYDLYKKGIPCLLLSQTLRPHLSKAILNRTLRVCTDEDNIISNTGLDVSYFGELVQNIQIDSIEEFQVYMDQIKRIIMRNLTPHQLVALQYMTSSVLRNIAFLIQEIIDSHEFRNKVFYKVDIVSMFLKVSCTFGCVSDILYLAMYLNNDGRYEHSFSYLKKAHGRISQPYIMYHRNVNENMYRQYTADMPLSEKLRIAVVKNVELNNDFSYVYKLAPEKMISKKNGIPVLRIPPLVMLHFLFILNYHRLGNTVRSQQSLQDLQTLLLYDDGVNVPFPLRDISWQVLGICQQVCGDSLGSLSSYQTSLQQMPFHKIQEATMLRMTSFDHEEFFFDQ
ncbi:uncharacterized protein LOC134237486 [Saccostrea cucullata]|uniref:uncharacterized protein LOC134237486 n=1 Tax=Saccostrea cuccullata TaxID=36930 RepID=UPI002ED63DF4